MSLCKFVFINKCFSLILCVLCWGKLLDSVCFPNLMAILLFGITRRLIIGTNFPLKTRGLAFVRRLSLNRSEIRCCSRKVPTSRIDESVLLEIKAVESHGRDISWNMFQIQVQRKATGYAESFVFLKKF